MRLGSVRRLLPLDRRRRRFAIAGIALVLIPLLVLIVIAAFPFSVVKPMIERRLSARFDRPVTIAAIERQDSFSLHPVIAIRGVRIPQPAWAGAGDLARIDRAEVTFPILPALFGHFRPDGVALSGARLVFVRAADRRENWRGNAGRDGGRSGDRGFDRLTIRDTRLTYRDAVQDRAVTLSVNADPQHGVHAEGRGMVRGSPIRLAFAGAPVAGRAGQPWAFRATIEGADLGLDARGTMARPLDTAHMSLDVTMRGRDLKMIDAIVEAGLFETRPVTLKAHVERQPQRWIVSDLDGTVGGSRIAGRVTVDKIDGRTKLDGAITSDRLDFEDFAAPGSVIAAAAKTRAIGPRIIPETRINIYKIWKTDGRISFRVARVVGPNGPSPITSLAGTATLDRQLLTLSPLTIGLSQGAIRGSVTVDQRGRVPVPRVTYDLRLTGSSIGALAGGGGSVTGRVDARAYLVGRGSTIRESVAHGDGRIGLAARDGSLPKRIADALGFDAGRALLSDSDARAGLRCVIVGFDLRGGTGRADPFVVDTTQSQLRGEGTLTFPGETLDIRLTGAPKQHAVLRLPGAAFMTGSIRAPDIVVPPEVKSVGNVLKALGRAITGRQGPIADDADCTSLAARVLR